MSLHTGALDTHFLLILGYSVWLYMYCLCVLLYLQEQRDSPNGNLKILSHFKASEGPISGALEAFAPSTPTRALPWTWVCNAVAFGNDLWSLCLGPPNLNFPVENLHLSPPLATRFYKNACKVKQLTTRINSSVFTLIVLSLGIFWD